MPQVGQVVLPVFENQQYDEKKKKNTPQTMLQQNRGFFLSNTISSHLILRNQQNTSIIFHSHITKDHNL